MSFLLTCPYQHAFLSGGEGNMELKRGGKGILEVSLVQRVLTWLGSRKWGCLPVDTVSEGTYKKLIAMKTVSR